MDRRNWPWRKKTSHNKASDVHKAPFENGISPSVAFKVCVEEPASRLQVPEQETPRFPLENARTLEAIALKEQAEEKVKALTEKVKTLTEKLNVSVGDLVSKDEMVNQHSKVAEEAVSGWEKAEAEAISLKQQLGASMQQKSMLEGRVAHLDEALKESMEQVRHTREEQQQKIIEAIDCKTQEWNKMKAEMDGIEADLRQRLMECDAQNSAMAKSLQERARAIAESHESKGRAETEVKLLQVMLESLDKEMSALKYELHVLNKELEIRNEEREYSKKVADLAHKHHLENVKKIARLESECQRLRSLLRKKLPGPAALAQMKMEADAGLRRDMTLSEQSKRRRSLGHAGRGGGSVSSSWDHSPLQHQHQTDIRESAFCKDIELMAERLLTMEEETKILKETLAKRTAELHSARQMCARTTNKLYVAESQLESLQGTPTSVSKNGILDCFLLQSEALNESSEKLDDEVSLAESWASALITELAHFKKDKVKQASGQSMDSSAFEAMEGLLEAQQHHDHQSVLTCTTVHEVATKDNNEQDLPQSKHTVQDRRTLKTLASKEGQLQSANIMCKDAIIKLASAEVKLRASKTPASDVEESVNSVAEAHGIVSRLDRILDEMRITVASVGDTTDDDSDNGINPVINGCQGQPKTSVELVTIPLNGPSDHATTNCSNSIPGDSLSFVLCKLIFLLERLLNPTGDAAMANSQAQKDVQGLVNAKDSFLQRKGSVMEFLLRFALMLGGICNSETLDLESLLSKELEMSSSMEPDAAKSTQCIVAAREDHNGRAGEQGGVDEITLDVLDYKQQLEQAKGEMQKQLCVTEAAKSEMEKQLCVTEEELRLTKAELAEAKVLIGDLQARMLDLQSEQGKLLADEEAKRGEVQAQLEKAETEVSKRQKSVASLTMELADQRKEYQGAVAKCEALDQKLQAYVDREQSISCRFDGEDPRARKEREVAAAKEKLAECQRTILVLGKQLTALTSPSAHSPAASCDSSLSLMNYGPLDHKPEELLDGRHQHHRISPYSVKRNDRRHVHSSDYTQQAQPAHYSHSNPRRILSDVSYRGSNGVQYSVAEHLRMDDGSSIYDSPPDSAVSSPSVSPTRDLAGLRRNPNSNAPVRTSLAKPLERAATNFRRDSKPNGSSSFSRFFSRTKK